jgi:hypothetical protein
MKLVDVFYNMVPAGTGTDKQSFILGWYACCCAIEAPDAQDNFRKSLKEHGYSE